MILDYRELEMKEGVVIDRLARRWRGLLPTAARSSRCSESVELIGQFPANLSQPRAAEVLEGYPPCDILSYSRRYRPRAVIDERPYTLRGGFLNEGERVLSYIRLRAIREGQDIEILPYSRIANGYQLARSVKKFYLCQMTRFVRKTT